MVFCAKIGEISGLAIGVQAFSINTFSKRESGREKGIIAFDFSFHGEYVYLWDFQKLIAMKRILYLIGFLLLAASCEEVFEAPPQSFLLASFYNSATNQTISPVTMVQGVDAEGLLFGDTAISKFLLPLTNRDTTRYVVWLDSTSDSLTFIHETTQKYASVETGFYYEYKLLAVEHTQNRIDSIRIIDSLVTTKWNENINLYIHPLPAGNN